MRRVPAGCEGVVVIHACTSPHTQQRTRGTMPALQGAHTCIHGRCVASELMWAYQIFAGAERGTAGSSMSIAGLASMRAATQRGATIAGGDARANHDCGPPGARSLLHELGPADRMGHPMALGRQGRALHEQAVKGQKRAKFGNQRLLVVTQGSHLPRALHTNIKSSFL